MDLLLAVVVITYVVKNAFTDMAYAVRGKTPPRLKYRMRRQLTAGGSTRYGARDYLSDLWHDAWEDAREKREASRAKQKARDKAKAGAKSKPGQVPTVATRPSADAEPTEKTAPPAHPPVSKAPGSDAPPAPKPTSPPVPTPAPQTPAPAGPPLASVTPIRSNRKEVHMNSTPTGETTTLAAAKQYTADMAATAAAAVVSVEQSRAYLEANEVTGDALSLLAEAQDLATQLQAKFEQAHAELAKQDVVRDAYEAAPGAGSKQFVTQE